MIAVLADLLTLGVAVAISPLSIVAVILMATSGKGRTNGTAFILGVMRGASSSSASSC